MKKVGMDGWKFIFYKDLKELYLGHKRKTKIKPNEFDVIARTLKPNRQKQVKLDKFV